MPLIIPDIIIQQALEAILATIKANWSANVDKTQTALYRMLNGVVLGKYDFYAQAQEVFLRTDANQRKIKIYQNYPKDKKDFPCVVINNPARTTDGFNSLGFNSGNEAAVINDINITFEQNTGRSFGSTYSILIFSDNKNEVNLIYYVLEAFFSIKQIFEHLQFSGLENLKISGREMQRIDDIPNGTFIKALQLNFFSTQVVDELTANSMVQDFTFGGLADNKLSLEGGTIATVEGLTYLGGQGGTLFALIWTDNSDSTGDANGNDKIAIKVFNSDQNEWAYFSSSLYVRSDEASLNSLPSTWLTGDNIFIYASFIRGEKQSAEIEINTTFIA